MSKIKTEINGNSNTILKNLFENPLVYNYKNYVLFSVNFNRLIVFNFV